MQYNPSIKFEGWSIDLNNGNQPNLNLRLSKENHDYGITVDVAFLKERPLDLQLWVDFSNELVERCDFNWDDIERIGLWVRRKIPYVIHEMHGYEMSDYVI